ncbi:hypothetical protein BX616_008728, partial [Lobosporangium transversale]
TIKHVFHDFINENSSNDKKRGKAVREIFQILNNEKMSPSTFLELAFNSNDPFVKHRVGLFESKGGPARVMGLWKSNRTVSRDGSFVWSAMEIVTEHVAKEMQQMSTKKCFHCPEEGLTPDFFKCFLFGRMTEVLKEHAPILTSTLA